MSKKYNNGDYLINQIMMFSNFFENFKKKDDINNMFVVLREIRVLHALMILKHNKIIKKLSGLDNPGSAELYDLSIFNNMLESTNNLIHEYEDYIYQSMENNKLIEKDDVSKKQEIIIDNQDIKKEIEKTYNNTDVDSKYNLNQPTIIYFYAPWCDFCKKFKPIWEELKNNTDKNSVNFIEVNCDKKEDKCKKFKINEFPTIKLFYNDKMYSFNQELTLSNLIEFIKKNTL